jgi:hypothetical protein
MAEVGVRADLVLQSRIVQDAPISLIKLMLDDFGAAWERSLSE